MTADQSNAADDDVVEVTKTVEANKCNQTTKAKRKRGRPKKIPTPEESTKEEFSSSNIAKRVRGTNRRVTNPGRQQLSPYKQL